MARSFKTAISFGLVFVPVTLHACIKQNDISFNTLYKKTGERIRYHKTCENCPDKLTQDDIVKGYQYEKDKYVILTDEELDKLKTKKNKSIEIESFVNLKEIDPIFYDKSYFIKPTGAESAFFLILKALEEEKKVGIAKTVLGTKEQLVAIRVINGQMVLNTMHFNDEVQASPVKEQNEKIEKKELDLAKLIIENMTEKFQPQKYKNEYREKLLTAINDKIEGKAIKGEKVRVIKPNVLNLMDALQKSVKQTTPKKKESTRKRA